MLGVLRPSGVRLHQSIRPRVGEPEMLDLPYWDVAEIGSHAEVFVLIERSQNRIVVVPP